MADLSRPATLDPKRDVQAQQDDAWACNPDCDLTVQKTVDRVVYDLTLSTRMARATNDALGRILDTQRRTLSQEDFAALACLRDTLSSCIASGKTREGVLSTYE